MDLSFFTGDGYISVHARLPNLVSEAQISGTTALLNAITRSIAVGSFELAKAIPIIDFKSGFIATDTHVSVELIKQCFDSCVYHVNFCYPVVSAFLAKSISLGQALEWADANWNDKPTLEFGK